MEKGVLSGIVVDADSKDVATGMYKFKYMDVDVLSDKNILYVSTEQFLSDEEVIKRFSGTYGFQKVVRGWYGR